MVEVLDWATPESDGGSPLTGFHTAPLFLILRPSFSSRKLPAELPETLLPSEGIYIRRLHRSLAELENGIALGFPPPEDGALGQKKANVLA